MPPYLILAHRHGGVMAVPGAQVRLLLELEFSESANQDGETLAQTNHFLLPLFKFRFRSQDGTTDVTAS